MKTTMMLAAIALADAKDGFVFLGATGDNALRPNGVWQGLYESFAGGVFSASTVGIHVAMNTPHTVDELNSKITATLSPLYEELQKTPGWKCEASDGDCTPAALLKDVQANIWPTRDADAQAKNMSSSLAGYGKVTTYLSIPPFVFGSWSQAAAKNWDDGSHRVHIAAEKPFGTSTADADALYAGIVAAVPGDNLHLVDSRAEPAISRATRRRAAACPARAEREVDSSHPAAGGPLALLLHGPPPARLPQARAAAPRSQGERAAP